MDDTQLDLEKEFCPPLDAALFHAILSDFDTSTAAELKAARSTLEALKQNAEAEEATGFDPSGSSTLAVDSVSSESAHRSSSHTVDGSRSGASRPRSAIDSERSDLSENINPNFLDSQIDVLSFEDKQALLIETFPNISTYTIYHTLRKCGEDFEKAINELLTAEFLKLNKTDGDALQLPRGAEGFAQNASFGKKKKSRKKKDKCRPIAHQDVIDTAREVNKWERGNQEIKFIAEKIKVPTSTIASYYHAEGASLSKAILAISKDQEALASAPSVDEPEVQINAAQLASDFPDVDIQVLVSLVRLAHPSTAAAHELARAVKRHPFPVYEMQTVESIVPSYARLKIEDSPSDASSDSSRTRKDRAMAKDASPHAAALADSYGLARQEAFAKASAAYRKSRSNPLMGGVAGYYASVGRDAHARAQAYSSEAADALVARQSTATSVDLHGVDVANAIRIAEQKVGQWWDGGAAEWARRGKVMGGDGFSIITGVGKHSQGGKGRLGPAVRKALANEGWAIEGHDGMLVVRGKAQR